MFIYLIKLLIFGKNFDTVKTIYTRLFYGIFTKILVIPKARKFAGPLLVCNFSL